MALIELSDIEMRVLDIVEMEFKITKEQYLDNFKVGGRIDFDLLVNSPLYNQILDFRTVTRRIFPNKIPALAGNVIRLGYIGLSQAPRRQSLDDDEFLGKETPRPELTKIDGLPDNRVILFETDLSSNELEDMAKSDVKRRLSYDYMIKTPPLNLIPVRLSGQFTRDYEEYRRRKGLPVDEDILGKSSLTLIISNTTSEKPLEISELTVSFKETFPRISWRPKNNGRLYPEKYKLVFSDIEIKPNSQDSFDIIADLDSIMKLGIIKAQLRAEIDSYTISGINIDKFFRVDGFSLDVQNWKMKQVTKVVADIELDPRAMEEALLHSQNLVFNLDEMPNTVFEDIIRYFNSSGYMLPSEKKYGTSKPHDIKSDTWNVQHNLDGIRKIFNDSVVRLNVNIEGEWGQLTEEKEIKSGGILTSKGKKNTYGRSTIRVMAQSTNQSRLNQCLEEISKYYLEKGK